MMRYPLKRTQTQWVITDPAPESDRGIRWNDETIVIAWPEIDSEILISAKDSIAKYFPDAEYFN